MLSFFDLETVRFRSGCRTPPIVCVSHALDDSAPKLHPSPDYREHVHSILGADRLIIAHNAPFDLLTMSVWCPGAHDLLRLAIRENRLVCTIVLQRLIEITTGQWSGPLSLAGLADRYGIEGLGSKEDGTRTNYGRLLGKPLSDYNQADVAYSLADTEVLRQLYHAQMKELRNVPELTQDKIGYVTAGHLVFNAISNYGMRTNPAMVDSLETAAERELGRLCEIAQIPRALPGNAVEEARIEELRAVVEGRVEVPLKDLRRAEKELDGFRLVRLNGVENTKRVQQFVTVAYDGKPPMTRPAKNRKAKTPFKPQPKRGHDVLVDSGDLLLTDHADFGVWKKVKSTDVPMLKAGVHGPIHTRFGIAASLRRTSSDPNLQNLRVQHGIREAFQPRSGRCFIITDHSSLEFVAVAEIRARVGDFRLAKQINEGIDPHCIVSKELMGCSYEEAVACKGSGLGWKTRQTGKVFNYGCLGLMSDPDSLAVYARGYGLKESRQYWIDGMAKWRRAQPGCVAFIESAKLLPRMGWRYITRIPGIDIPRRGVPLTAALNTQFQGLGAVIETEVALRFFERMQDPDSALYHCALVNQVHDSFVFEVPFDLVTSAFGEIETVMVEAPKRYLKHVRIGCESVATIADDKRAKLKRGADGEVLIWVAPDDWRTGKEMLAAAT